MEQIACALCNHKSTILVCMILNGKGLQTGCGQRRYSHGSVLFNRSIQNSCLKNKKYITDLLLYIILPPQRTLCRVNHFITNQFQKFTS